MWRKRISVDGLCAAVDGAKGSIVRVGDTYTDGFESEAFTAYREKRMIHIKARDTGDALQISIDKLLCIEGYSCVNNVDEYEIDCISESLTLDIFK